MQDNDWAVRGGYDVFYSEVPESPETELSDIKVVTADDSDEEQDQPCLREEQVQLIAQDVLDEIPADADVADEAGPQLL